MANKIALSNQLKENGRLFPCYHLKIKLGAASILLGLTGLGSLINMALVLISQVGIDIRSRLRNNESVETAVIH